MSLAQFEEEHAATINMGIMQNKSSCLDLFEADTYALPPCQQCSLAFQPVINLLMVESGKITVSDNETELELTAGQVWLVEENQTLTVNNTSASQDALIISVRLHLAMISRFKHRYDQALLQRQDQRSLINSMIMQGKAPTVFPSSDLTRMAITAFRLFGSQGDEGLYALKLEELLLLNLKSSKGHLLAFQMLTRTDPAKEKFRQFVEENVLNDWSLSTYAKQSAMSLTAFKVMFNQVFCETSPKAWINEKRLQHADKELRTTRKRIIDIAMESGFSSQSYFTQSYKARFGRSPSDTRQNR